MDRIAQIRSFNRTVTRHIGALDGHFLGRNRSLAACRLLFEIGLQGVAVRDLRARLGLDSGYTSRLLRSLEKEGLVRTDAGERDARVRRVALTAAGRKELAVLNRLSDDAAEAILEPLSEKQRAALADAMGAVEKLLVAGSVRFEIVDPLSSVAQYCLARYFEELAARFEGGFEPARSPYAQPGTMTAPRGYFVVATLNGETVGCGGLKCHAGWGEIKRMWIAGVVRGLGLGRRMLEYLEGLARKRRLAVIKLETNKSLKEAQSLYKSTGYREVAPFNDEPYAHHWFEKQL